MASQVQQFQAALNALQDQVKRHQGPITGSQEAERSNRVLVATAHKDAGKTKNKVASLLTGSLGGRGVTDNVALMETRIGEAAALMGEVDKKLNEAAGFGANAERDLKAMIGKAGRL